MALINGALQIGRTALTAAQAGLMVTGNNMANAATPSYSRQSVHLVPTQYAEVVPGKYSGTGVAIESIYRQVDEALNGRIQGAMSDSAYYQVLLQAMARVEAVFNELTEEDLSSHLNAFFAAWSSLQNQPQDMASRSVVLQEGKTLAAFIRSLRSQLTSIQDDLDSQLRFQITEANSLIEAIAVLNQQIVAAESGRPGSAAALRDQRDAMLNDLSELVSFTTKDVEGGSVNLFIGNDPVIQNAQVRNIAYVESQDQNGNWLAQIVFSDNNQTLEISGGKMQGLIAARDDQVGAIISGLDSWTGNFVYEVNRLHTLGSGLEGYTSVTSTFSVDDAGASLADTTDLTGTGLPWPAGNGVFFIDVTDSSGVTSKYQINVNVDPNEMSLNDLVAEINSQMPVTAPVTASVDASNRLRIDAAAGFSFSFSSPEDSSYASDVLAVLGVNTFFQGSSSFDIDTRSDLTAAYIAASATGLAGDGSVAGSIAALAETGVTSLSGATFSEEFTTMIGSIAADSRITQDNYTAADVVVQTLQAERQSISGVSIDEEAISMITYQRAFQGAARYISIVDMMLDEILALTS